MATIRIVTGPLAGAEQSSTQQLTVGRADSGFDIQDPGLSRRHLRLTPVAGGTEVEDLARDATRISFKAGRTDATAARDEPQREPDRVGASVPAGPRAAGIRRVRDGGGMDQPAIRMLAPATVTSLTILATAVALVIYFAGR